MPNKKHYKMRLEFENGFTFDVDNISIDTTPQHNSTLKIELNDIKNNETAYTYFLNWIKWSNGDKRNFHTYFMATRYDFVGFICSFNDLINVNGEFIYEITIAIDQWYSGNSISREVDKLIQHKLDKLFLYKNT